MTKQRSVRRRLAPVLAVATMCVAFFGGASSAWAGVALSTSPDIPEPNGPVTVGQTNLVSKLTIQNTSTSGQAGLNVTLSAITLVPSCGVIASVDCPAAFYDPDVFSLSATGTGEASTACAGQIFTINNVDSLQDKYEFVPTTPATPVVLGPANGSFNGRTCIIDFTVNVLKVPTIDARPEAGVQTNELAGANGTASDLQTGQGTGTNNTTVNKATLVLATAVSATPITLGQSFTDTATLSGLPPLSPVPTGSVTFTIYSTASCTGPPLFSSTNALNGAGTSATSSSYTPPSPGTYHVIASYSGDANYNAVAGACNDPGENVVVNKATPSIATAVSGATLTLGQSFTDTATVTHPAALPAPTGNVTFVIYGPGDATCVGTPVFTSPGNSVSVATATTVTATSASFTPQAPGTYRVIATYNGDANYNTIAGLCNDANEQVVVSKATPTIVTAVSNATRTLGESFTDLATVTTPAGVQVATGDVTFRVYGPGDTTCSALPVFTSATRPLAGATATTATASSASFTPQAPGTYRVIATYNGDANYNTIAGLCNDANEQVVVSKATPTIVTAVSNATRTLGESFTDLATVTTPAGVQVATGDVTFRVYGPGDTTCSALPVFTSATRPLAGATATTATATSASFTPQAPGTYRVIATYNGDANYNTIAGLCNDPGENVVVSKATPTIVTAVSNATRTLGESFTDLATVTTPTGVPVATGDVTFRVYGPGDTTCSALPVFTSATRPLAGATATTATATSASFTPQAPGTYRVIATYNGDANYNTIAGLCNDANEQVVVSKATPTIVTAVSNATRTLGESFTDLATVTTPAGVQVATGDVTFRVYGPGDTTCSALPVFTSATRPLAGATATTATATSASFTPQAPGTYRVIATYNGDANYNTIAGLCNDPGENVVVSKATPTIVTAVSNATRTLGESFTDLATVTFPSTAPTPTGDVTFRVYGPGDTTCTASPVFTSAGNTVGSPTATTVTATSSSFTPTAPGTYRVIATYNGDGNYNTIAGLCNDPGENVVVSKATPTIVTAVSNATRTLGESFTDTATVTFPSTAPTPTGNVTFVVYGPGDATCTAAPVFTSPPSTVGSPTATTVTATSASFTPQAPGTYRVIATYNGDANYNTIAGLCADANEQVVVAKATPTILTQVSNAARTLGESFTDTATVTTPAGVAVATGNVTFVVYGPGDTTCTATPVFTSAARTLSGATATTATASSASFTPTAPGTYRVIATYNGDTNYNTIAGLCGDANEQVVVAKASPAIATSVSAATRTLGQSFTDMANVTVPAGLPAPTGTVDFVVYAPGDSNCTGTPVFSSTGIALNGSGSATSASFTPTAIGTYRVIAVYSGDANYTPVAGLCNDTGENVVVSKANPGITTLVSNAARTLGQSFTDTATLTFPPAAPAPTGDVTFVVYGPGDTTCTAAPVFTSAARPLTGATATSASFTPSAVGTYRVIATYNGDGNYNSIAGLCGDAGEQVVVSSATPTIATAVSNPTRTLGQAFTDVATVTAAAGAPVPTGTVTFVVYGPGDTTCTATPVFSSAARPLSPATATTATATSASFTPAAPGTYRVIASYNGDASYNMVAGQCNDPGENVVVTKATPAIATQVSDAARTLGQSFTDTASVTVAAGLPAPSGTVDFAVYAPGDATCTGTPVFSSTNNALNGSGVATSGSFTPTAIGTYRVIATYSGDANYTAIAGACNDPGENVVVSKATPGITTLVSNAARTLGESFTDTATVTFPAGAPTPTGNVTFVVYGPGDTTCTGTPVFTSAARPLTGATATSSSFTPAAPGTYRVIASYGGDGNYNPIAGACNDPGENVVVSKATPAISTAVSDATRTLGQSFTDTATVTVAAGLPTPTGTVDFAVYAPGDTTCTGAPVFTSTANALNGSGVATSGSFAPTVIGTYRVIATYGGDANYNAIAGLCNDPGENVVVSKATPTIVTAVSDATRVLGQTFTDTATVTSAAGAPVATGTVTFVVYGPGDATCTATPVFTSAARPLSGATATTATATSATFTPAIPGTYRVIATYNGDASYNTIAGSCNDANEQVVLARATPAIATQVSDATRTLGQSFTDTASVTVAAGLPAPTGTVDFAVYAPGDTTCTGTPVFTSANRAVDGSGNATSASFTPTAIGTYRVIASYSGDGNYTPIAGACNDAGEQVVVSKATPSIVTAVSNATRTLGQSFTDTATLTFPAGAPAPTGDVTFRVYGPADATCTGTPAFTSAARPLAAGTATTVTSTSASFTPTAPGTYRVIATYNGDANYNTIAGACNDANEQVVVAKATPAIATQVSNATRIVGQSFTDTATLTIPAGAPAPTGDVTFRVYGPGDATCTGTPVFTSANRPLSGVTATSAAFSPASVGTYRVIATYNGDANYNTIAGACADANEQVVVSLASPTIVTNASGDVVLGSGTLTDNATVSGLVSPVTGAGAGTVEFRLYRPGDTTCTGTPLLTRTSALTLNAGNTQGTATSGAGYVPTEAGTYRWRALYSGDANNAAVAGACNDANESTIVARSTPTIVTNASPDIVQGGVLTDNATVNGLVHPVDGGTITFRLYGPDDATCSGTAVFVSTVPYPATGGSVPSQPYTPIAPGAYRWVATYSGDANNTPVSGLCNDANEIARVTVVLPPPPPPIVVPPPPPPPQEVLPEETTPKGTAAVTGKTGCYGTPFNVVVSGRQIERVIYSIDGKVVKTLMAPNSGSRYKLPIIPKRFKTGTHRVLARVIFTTKSKTKNRTLRVVFSRCAKKASSPAFTG